MVTLMRRQLLRKYLEARIVAAQFGDLVRLQSAIIESERFQDRLWALAVKNVGNMESAFLLVESLNAMFAAQASRVAVGLQDRIPAAVWRDRISEHRPPMHHYVF